MKQTFSSEPKKAVTSFSQEDNTLTPYHWERRKAAVKAVEEMSKPPYSSQEVSQQIEKNKAIAEQRKKEQDKKKS